MGTLKTICLGEKVCSLQDRFMLVECRGLFLACSVYCYIFAPSVRIIIYIYIYIMYGNDQMSIVVSVNVVMTFYFKCATPGKTLQLHLQACDVKSKEEKSGPENMLTETSTGDGKPEATHNHRENNNGSLLHKHTVCAMPSRMTECCLVSQRLPHRKRQEESQCDPVDGRPEQLSGHSDEDQSEASFSFQHFSENADDSDGDGALLYSLLCALRCEREPSVLNAAWCLHTRTKSLLMPKNISRGLKSTTHGTLRTTRSLYKTSKSLSQLDSYISAVSCCVVNVLSISAKLIYYTAFKPHTTLDC